MRAVFRSARGGSESGRFERVLDRDRQPVQRPPALAARQGGICFGRSLERAVVERYYGVYRRVEAVDSRAKVMEQLTAADLSFAQRRRELGCGLQRQVDVGADHELPQ